MTLEIAKKRCLEWKIFPPSANKSYTSPMFWFQDIEWFLELTLNVDKSRYDIFFRSKNEPDDFPKLFRIDSCIEKGDEQICFYSEIIHKKSSYIGQFFLADINKTKLNLADKCKFVFNFDGDIGLTLRIGKDEESGLRKLSQDTYKLLNEGLFHDVEIQCDDEIFKAHKIILSSRSEVFRKMFENDTLEKKTGKVQIVDINSNFFKLFLRYLYSGMFPDLSSESAIALYEVGDKYEVKDLMRHCVDFLMDTLKPERACEMLILADIHSDAYFTEVLLAYMHGQKIPLKKEIWVGFCDSQPKLALKVINRLYEMQVTD